MKRPFVLSAPAAQDVEEIVAYIEGSSGNQRALHVAERLQEAFLLLAENPGLGHKREDLAPSHLRLYKVWSYFVIYRAGTASLEIARVVHAARDLPSLLRDE